MNQRIACTVALLLHVACGRGMVTDVEVDVLGEAVADEAELDLIYDTTVVTTYEVEIEPDVWEEMLADPLSDEYREATFRWGDEVYSPVGVRFKGNSSRWMIQREGGLRYSLKIKFGEYVDGLTFHGVKKLNLHNGFHDPSFMRERLSYDLFRDAGVPASRVAYANVNLNGERHGLFISVEQVNKTFLREWFDDDDGNLYKPEIGELVYRGDSIDRYTHPEDYELKTNEDEPDHTGLLHFMDVLANTPEAELETALDEVLEVETFLRWLAANSLLLALDSYQGSIAHNYYLYDNPSTGKFVYIPWDLNGSFGVFSCGMSWDQRLRLPLDQPYCTQGMGGPAGGSAIERPLIERVLSVPGYQARYEELLSELLADRFTESRVDDDIEQWEALIAEHVFDDPTKLTSWEDFLSDMDQGSPHALGLRAFVSGRTSYLHAALAGQVEVTCGDGICDSGETCEADCTTVVECPPCAVPTEDGHCIPTCADSCECPDDLPVELTCNPDGMCVPTAPPCECPPNLICAPNGNCVPRCAANSDCPPLAPICEPASGLCHS